MTQQETCAQKTCRCTKPYSKQTQAMSTAPLEPNATYCSKRCAELARGIPTDDACECGHPECSAIMSRGIPEMM